ncbi:MAG: D-isomer specific 2-hydroxyacid dehydrogenase NAD-binding protein [Clostridiales bacterium]|jgi:glycerate dehydrogenase|nr:D-isomer specific 2-hydroxyacid dehydrogenase NAD-binding protein [Clostridiales bacterium]
MKIAILDANTLGDDLDLTVFEKYGETTTYGYTKENEVSERIKDVDIIITNKIVLNESNLKDAHNVKLICLTATGTNNVDKEYTKSRKIGVANVKGYSSESVAQHTFALLFYLFEKLSYYDNYVKSGAYTGDKMFTHFERKYSEINNKTWGIIGLGAIGKRVASIASAFNCNVVYYSTSGRNNNSEYERLNLEELLRTSDIISIHAPLDESTTNLIGYNELSKMKKSAIIINVGRGKIINEADLARALSEDLIAGAGIDVLEYEPINEGNPLLEIKDSTKLLITPHIAWASVEARNRLIEEVCQNIEAYIEGKERNIV